MNPIFLILNKYVRNLGRIVNITLVLLIFVLYGLELSEIINVPVSLEVICFLFLTINNVLFLIYASSLRKKFNKQVEVYLRRGIPLESTEGFQYSRNAVDKSVGRSITLNILTVLGNIFHFTPELVPVVFPQWLTFVSYLGISMVLISMSLFLRIDYPDHSLLQPGNFISYHQPQSYPTFLDNVLADSLKSFMDPRTRFQLDNWFLDISTKLHPDFERNERQELRVDRAIERIILILYLQKKVPELVSDKILRKDLRKIVNLQDKKEFMQGTQSGISLEIISSLIDIMMEQVPEIFTLVDRLLVEVMINPTMFRKTDRIIETVIPEDRFMDVNQPFRVLVYVLNMAEHTDKRIFEVIAESSRHIEPPKSTVKFELDEPEEKIRTLIQSHDRHEGDLVYSDRIVEILSNMLQVGDVTWLQFIPQEYGSHVLNLIVKENEFQRYGTSVPIDVQFSLRNKMRKLMSSMSGVTGAIYPILKVLLLNPLF